MKQKFQGITRVKHAHLQALRKEYEMLHMKEGEFVNEYIARVLVITNKMKANCEDLKEVAIVEKIMRSLTPNFNYVVTHGNQYTGRGRGRGNFGSRGRGRNRQSFDKATVECYVCHKLVHFQWECKKGVANFAKSQAENEEYMLLMAYVPKGEEREQHETDMWFLDSGCNNHMCGKREYFSDFDEKFTDSVKLGNNLNMVVNGKGNIRLKINGVVSIVSAPTCFNTVTEDVAHLSHCSEHGVQKQLTAAYSPQQNGVAEWKNRTIVNLVHSMLSEKNVPRTFWSEAVKWVVRVLNRSPTLAVKDKTPEKAWSGLKPSVQHFKIFGCVTYVHIQDNSRTKLDEKSLKCVLLGISEESKAYRLYNPISRWIIVSRDVVFEESEEWELDKQHESTILCEFECEDDEEVVTRDDDAENVIEEHCVEDDTAELEESPVPTQETFFKPHRKEEETTINLAKRLCGGTDADPLTFEEAVKSENWRNAMDAEIEAIEKNGTWELIDQPKGAKTVEVKWVYKD
ncbi:UNVERIFIED_CONTAM: Retrovirus-related Pol polyprotein from transposon TNT 1-94 [Sesamum calycinum]|uniref:Retrovirus-related Pol polyprotein from transposon TNT 1-94 n=1 Tax=Sesamum calycinum TaxID=2727403 RepID=A0AAW2J3A9_9LAMI